MHLQELVDLGSVGARTRRDAPLALAVEHLRVAALGWRHRLDDRLLPLQRLLTETGGGHLIFGLAHSRHHAHDGAHAAHAFHLRQLLGHVFQVEHALAHFLGDSRRLGRVDGLDGLVDQGHHVAHAQDAPGNAVRIKVFERVPFFAGTDQLDRFAGDRTHTERRAAAPVAIDAREHDAGDADFLVETLGEVHRVLARKGIRDQQCFVRVRQITDGRGFGHQLFVNMGAASGVEDHHIVAAEAGGHHGAGGDLSRALAENDGERRDAGLFTQYTELFLRGRTARIQRGQQHLFAVAVGKAFADFRRGRGFARALQANHQYGDGRRRIEIDRLGIGAEHGDEFVMDDLDHQLARRHRFQHRLANGLGPHLVRERAHHVQRYVSFQQRPPHFAHGVVDVGLAERAAPGEAREH